MHDTDIRDAPRQMVSVFRQFSNLVQDEMALAKAEISRNLSRAGVGVAFIGVAALLALVALNALADAAVVLLATTGISLWVAALIVGGVLLAIALIFVLIGKSRLSADALAPSRTVDNVKKDIAEIKETGHV